MKETQVAAVESTSTVAIANSIECAQKGEASPYIWTNPQAELLPSILAALRSNAQARAGLADGK